MKKFLNKLAMLFLILTLSLGISAVAAAYDDAEIIFVNEQYLGSWNSTDFQEYLKDESLDAGNFEQFTKWQEVKNKLGGFSAIEQTVVNEADGIITAVTTAAYENGKLTFTMTYDMEVVEGYGAQYGILSIDAQSVETQGGASASLAKAGLNTLLSMVIIFLALIVISVVISLIKYVPVLLGRVAGSKEKEAEQVEGSTVFTEEEAGLVDDTELVAVITAAIAEYETGNAGGLEQGGFVVRSIRRRR